MDEIRKILLASVCFLLLDIVGPWWPRAVQAAQASPVEQAEANLTRDYQGVRKAALALTVLGFLFGLIRLGMSEFPAERSRAQSLVAMTSVLFLLVAGDRLIARGISEWFNIQSTSLPPFWR